MERLRFFNKEGPDKFYCKLVHLFKSQNVVHTALTSFSVSYAHAL